MQETLTIEFPRARTVEDLETVCQQAADKALIQAVLDLIHRGEISAGYGAELLGMNTVDMIERLSQQGIALADYPADDLLKEVADAMRDFTVKKD